MNLRKVLVYAVGFGVCVTILSGLYSTNLSSNDFFFDGFYSALVRGGYVSVVQHGFPMPWVARVVAVYRPSTPSFVEVLSHPRFSIVGFVIDVVIWSVTGLVVGMSWVLVRTRGTHSSQDLDRRSPAYVFTHAQQPKFSAFFIGEKFM